MNLCAVASLIRDFAGDCELSATFELAGQRDRLWGP